MNSIIRELNIFRKFLFSTPTRAIEFVNGLALFFFAVVFAFNREVLLINEFYVKFNYIGPTWIWSIVLLLGIIQLVVMQRDTLESNLVSTIVLKLSALAWFLIAIMFGSDYPPLSTAFFTYMSMSLITVLAAYELSEQNIMELLIREDNRDD